MKSVLNILWIMSARELQTEANTSQWFIAGAIIAILLLVYLIISLVKPEKF